MDSGSLVVPGVLARERDPSVMHHEREVGTRRI